MWPDWKKSPVRRRLLFGAIGSLFLPWLLGECVKTFHQPGMDDRALSNQLLIDYIVAGSVLFLLSMVLTYAIGCWITAVMHGPRRDGDAFPSNQGTPSHDD
jgi:hypothetical protein